MYAIISNLHACTGKPTRAQHNNALHTKANATAITAQLALLFPP